MIGTIVSIIFAILTLVFCGVFYATDVGWFLILSLVSATVTVITIVRWFP